jgi:hypothetical protein
MIQIQAAELDKPELGCSEVDLIHEVWGAVGRAVSPIPKNHIA